MQYILKDTEKYSDTEIIKGILEKDDHYISYFIKQTYPSAKNLVLFNKGTIDDVNDMMQDSLILLFRKLQDENFILTCSLKSFFLSVVRLNWLNELRRQSRLSSLGEEFNYVNEDEIQISEQDILYNKRMLVFREKFNELSEDCKKILKLFLNKVPLEEIRKMMGYSTNQHTRNRKYRCKESLVNRIKSSELFKKLGHGDF